jgi:hypothetical protein
MNAPTRQRRTRLRRRPCHPHPRRQMSAMSLHADAQTSRLSRTELRPEGPSVALVLEKKYKYVFN